MRLNGGAVDIDGYSKKQRPNVHRLMKANERENGAGSNDQSQKSAGAIARARCLTLHGGGEGPLHQQSGRERSAYDQGTAEDLRLLPLYGGERSSVGFVDSCQLVVSRA